jgi:hypothetical protein
VPTAGTEHLLHTANGVRPVTNHLKWLAVALFTTAVVSGSGVGVYIASAQEKGKPAETKQPDEKKPAAETPKPDTPKAEVKTADDVQKALKAVVTVAEAEAAIGDILHDFELEHGLTIRLDTVAFRRHGWHTTPEFEDINNILTRRVKMSALNRVPLEDALRAVLAHVWNTGPDGRLQFATYRIKGTQILIVPEYQPTVVPGSGANGEPFMTTITNIFIEQMYGETVTVRYKKKSLTDVIDDLQERTGANIVLNMRNVPEGDPDKAMVTANFNDTRLLTVLKIVGDMHGLKPVVIDNVFYLTDRESADELQAEVNRDLFPTPPAPETK